MQLDIFDDGREVMLANDAVQALAARNVRASKAACKRLAQGFPAHHALAALFTLAGYIEESEATRHHAFSDHEMLREARRVLDDVIAPAARRSFGEPDAIPWLGASWRSLAQRAGSLAFNGRRPQDHAAALWLRAGCWETAAQAVAAIESWRRIPAPLAWMVEARLHLVGLQSTWPILAELAWLAPALLEEVARRASDPLLTQLVTRFEAGFEPLLDAPSSELRTTHDMAWSRPGFLSSGRNCASTWHRRRRRSTARRSARRVCWSSCSAWSERAAMRRSSRGAILYAICSPLSTRHTSAIVEDAAAAAPIPDFAACYTTSTAPGSTSS